VILFRIADGPISYQGLMRLFCHRFPRILPDAVECAIAQLHRLKFIECHRGKWRVSRG
jgi:hypothetical protein